MSRASPERHALFLSVELPIEQSPCRAAIARSVVAAPAFWL